MERGVDLDQASEAVHELDLVRVVERENRCVRIPVLLSRLRVEEVLRARLVRDVRKAIELGNLDGNRRDHRDVEVLVEHRRAAANPQVRRRRPRVRLVLERDRHRRLHVEHGERRLSLPRIGRDVERVERCRGVGRRVRRGRARRVGIRAGRGRLEEDVRWRGAGRDRERIELRQVEDVRVGVLAAVGIPPLRRVVESRKEGAVGWDVVVAHALSRELRGRTGAYVGDRYHWGRVGGGGHVHHGDVDRLLVGGRWRWHREGTASDALRNCGDRHNKREAFRVSFWIFCATGLALAIGGRLLALDPLGTVDVVRVQHLVLFL